MTELNPFGVFGLPKALVRELPKETLKKILQKMYFAVQMEVHPDKWNGDDSLSKIYSDAWGKINDKELYIDFRDAYLSGPIDVPAQFWEKFEKLKLENDALTRETTPLKNKVEELSDLLARTTEDRQQLLDQVAHFQNDAKTIVTVGDRTLYYLTRDVPMIVKATNKQSYQLTDFNKTLDKMRGETTMGNFMKLLDIGDTTSLHSQFEEDTEHSTPTALVEQYLENQLKAAGMPLTQLNKDGHSMYHRLKQFWMRYVEEAFEFMYIHPDNSVERFHKELPAFYMPGNQLIQGSVTPQYYEEMIEPDLLIDEELCRRSKRMQSKGVGFPELIDEDRASIKFLRFMPYLEKGNHLLTLGYTKPCGLYKSIASTDGRRHYFVFGPIAQVWTGDKDKFISPATKEQKASYT